MYHTYILYSLTRDKYYIGYSSNIEERIIKHNSNHKGYTGGTGDWQLMWKKSFELKSEAMSQEKEIKRWKSRKKIETLITEKDTLKA
jgi:putative endonuclease